MNFFYRGETRFLEEFRVILTAFPIGMALSQWLRQTVLETGEPAAPEPATIIFGNPSPIPATPSSVPGAWSGTARLFADHPQEIWRELTGRNPLELDSKADFSDGLTSSPEIQDPATLALQLADQAEQLHATLDDLSAAQDDWHSLPLEGKAAVVENWLQLGRGYLELAAVPQVDPEDGAYTREELSLVAERSFELAANFAADDDALELNQLAPLFTGFQHLAAGEIDQAVSELEQVDYIPEARDILNRLEEDQNRLTQLALLECWEAFNREAKASEWDALQGAVGVVTGAIQYYSGSDETVHDKHFSHWDGEEKLSLALRQKLESGEAQSLHEALQQIANEGKAGVSDRAAYYLSPELRYFSGEFGPQLSHLVLLSQNTGSDTALRRLQEIAWDLHAREGFVETPLALYTLGARLGTNVDRQNSAMETREEIIAALQDDATWSYSAQKLLHNLNPKDLAEVAPLLLAGGVGNLARLGALARLEAAGVTGFKATALAFGAEVVAEGSTLWALNTAHAAAFHDMSQVFTPEQLARSYGASILMIGGLKGMGRFAQRFSPRLAYSLGMVTAGGQELSLTGRVLTGGLNHLLGMSGMVGTSKVLQWMELQAVPQGGERFSILSDVFFYWKFSLLHRVADSLTLGKVSNFQGRMHREVAIREARLLAKDWTGRLGITPEQGNHLAVLDRLMQVQLTHPQFSVRRWVRYLERGKIHQSRNYLRKHGLHGELGPLVRNLKTTDSDAPFGLDWLQANAQIPVAMGLVMFAVDFPGWMESLGLSWGAGEGPAGFLPLIMGTVQSHSKAVRTPDMIQYHEDLQLGIYDAGTLFMDEVPGRNPRHIFYEPDGNGGRLLRKTSNLKRVEIPASKLDLKAEDMADLVQEAFRFGIEIELTGNQGWKIVHRENTMELYQGTESIPRFTLPETLWKAKPGIRKSVSLKIIPNEFELQVLRDLGVKEIHLSGSPENQFLIQAARLGFKRIVLPQEDKLEARNILEFYLSQEAVTSMDVVVQDGKGKTRWQVKNGILSGREAFIRNSIREMAEAQKSKSKNALENLQSFIKSLPVQVPMRREILMEAAVSELTSILPGVSERTLQAWLERGQIFSGTACRNALQKGATGMADEFLPYSSGLNENYNAWAKAVFKMMDWARRDPAHQRELQTTFENLERDSIYSPHLESNAYHLARFFNAALSREGLREDIKFADQVVLDQLREMNRRYEENRAENLSVGGTLFDVFLSEKDGGKSEIQSFDLWIAEGKRLAAEGYEVSLKANPTSKTLEGPTPDFTLNLSRDGWEQSWSIEVKKGGAVLREWLETGADAQVLLQGLTRGFRNEKNKTQASFGEQLGHGFHQLQSQTGNPHRILEVHLERAPTTGDVRTLTETLQSFLKQEGLAVQVRLIYPRYWSDEKTGASSLQTVTRWIEGESVRESSDPLPLLLEP